MDGTTAGRLTNFLRTDRANECLISADALLMKDGGDCLARAYRGIALGILGDTENSLVELKRSAESAVGNDAREIEAFARHYLGLGLIEHGDVRLGFLELERAVKLGLRDPGLLTALCQTAVKLGQADAAKKWGEQALQKKADSGKCRTSELAASRRPKAFDPDARDRNIISYSLFGNDPFYHECAVTTARQVQFVYPEFTARFYCAETVPQSVLRFLAATGAQVQIKGGQSGPLFAGLFWRFLPFEDSDVDVVLVRDVDSPPLPRERAAVDQWLASDLPFHVMRDHVQHTAPILAGLWGGFTRVLPKLVPPMEKHLLRDTTRFCDQNFLREFVWPRIRHATLTTDSIYTLGNTVDFPHGFPKRGRLHVGFGWSRQQI